MAKSLSVLFAGELDGDTQLILRALKKGGYKPAFEQVKTGAQLKKTLKNQSWEVVISGNNLPRLNGKTSLKILQESGKDIPFIVVSGDLDEEAAVEMLKCGSCDCISKSNLKRLVPVVRRELTRAAERQQGQELEAALRESEDKFKYAFDHSVTGKSVTLPSGEIDVNQAFCKMLGYTKQELTNRKWQEITHPEDIDLTQHAIDKLISGEQKLVRFTKRYIHKNGSVVWTDVGIALRFDKRGQPLYFISSINNISERILAEEALRGLSVRQEAILAAVPDILMEVNNDKVYTWANPSGLEFFGKDVIGKNADDYFEGEQTILTAVAPLFQGKKDVIYLESWQKRKDGNKRLLAWWCRALKDKNGKVTGALSSAHDITASRADEEGLRASEERFRAWIENSSDIVSVIGVDGRIQYESPSIERLLGYKPTELIGRPVFDSVHPDDRERVMEIFNNNIQKPGDLTSLELRFRHHDGSWRVLEVLGKPYLDEHGQMAALVNSRDITERKRIEEELREGENRYQLVFENSGTANTIFDKDCRVVLQNSMSKELSPVRKSFGKTALDIFGPELGPLVTRRMKRVMKTGVAEAFETHLTFPKGDQWIRSSYQPLRNNKGGVAGIQVIAQDITEYKQAEEALRQSEEKFRVSFMISMDAFYWSTLDEGRIIDVNPVFEEVWGYTREEIIGRTSLELGLYYDPDNRAKMVSELKDKGQVKDLELKGKRKDGRLITVSLSTSKITLNNEEYILGVIRDITEKKRADQQKEILYQVLRAVSGQLETENVARSAVETFVKLTGYPHVCIALPDEKRTHWAVRAAAGSLAAELGATYPIHKGVIGNAFKTGQTQWVRDVLKDPHYVNDVKAPGGPALRSEFVALMRSGDNVLGALNVESDRADAFDDSDIWLIQSVADIISLALQNARLFGEAEQEIRERKHAEEELKKTEKRTRELTEFLPLSIFEVDAEGNLLSFNKTALEVFKYTQEDFVAGMNALQFFSSDEWQRVGENIAKVLRGESFPGEEYTLRRKDGSTFTGLLFASPVILENEPVGIRGAIIDITERKQTQTLQEAVYRIAAAAETTRSLDDLYPQIHQIISSVMPAQYFYITLYDEAQNLLRFPYFRDAEDEPFVGGIQPAKGLTAYVLRTGKSLLCTQAVHDELERLGEVKLLGVASAIWLGVPLIVEGKTIGAMVVQHYTDPLAYGEREQHMLEFVSTQVAIAINRLQAEEEIRSLNTQLEKRVVERTRELRLAQDKIVRQEKLALLGQLAGGVGHELRNPLGIISNAIYYLKFIQPEADEKVKQYHAMIEQEVRNSDKIITDLLDFARLDAVDREPVSVRELVQRTLTRFPVPEPIITSFKISEDLPKAFADMAQMEQVLGNLTVNACQAMMMKSTDGAVTKVSELTITARRQQEMVAIAVKDTGVGITRENMDKLFEPLFTTKSKGIGLGLAVSRKLAEANGGRIEVKSELGKGSTFTLVLPMEGK